MLTFIAGVVVGALGTGILIAWLVANAGLRHALASGIRVSWPMILGMRIRGTAPDLVIDAAVALRARGKQVPLMDLEAAYLAHPAGVVDATDLVRLVERQLDQAKAGAGSA